MKKIQKPIKEKFEISNFKVIFNFESVLCSNEPHDYIKEIEAQLVIQNISTPDKNVIVGVANIYKVELGRAMNERQSTTEIFDGCTPKTGAVELLLATIGFHSDSKIIKISHSVSSI